MTTTNPIFCAIDTAEVAPAKALATKLKGSVGGLKLGLEFFMSNGPQGYREIAAFGGPVFLDLKLHDIPNTVARAMHSLASLSPAITTVHAGGGSAMMRAAVIAAAEAELETGRPRPKIVGVTVLTSLDADDLDAVGITGAVDDQVRRLAALAAEAGVDGVVCAPHEIETVRRECGDDFLLVVPGIRPAGAAIADQKRVMTPREALERGADVLVIGRPITGAADPVVAAAAIAADLR